MNTIELKSLSIGYKTKRETKYISKDLTATVRNGELTCLLGANGVGKSTLLRTLTSSLPKLSGEIIYNGKELECYNSKMLSSIISIVLTDRITVKNLSVFDMVALGRTPYTGFWGSLEPKDVDIINESLKIVKAYPLKDRMIDTLSDGERQKVMIAKALAQQTPIILLDEPTAFLDFPSKVDMMQLLHNLSRKTGKTIFLSTHDLDLALQIADRIWLMDQTKGLKTGTPEDLSLDGSLSTFFERRGVAFDKERGGFRIENEVKEEIQLIGEGTTTAMIRKALLRNSILATKSATPHNGVIEVTKDGFIVNYREKKGVATSIEELLKIILE